MARCELGKVPVEQIHNQTEIVDGRKMFGDFDWLVETDTITSEFVLNSGKPKLAIVISTMDRDQRLKETLRRLIDSVDFLGMATRIVIMDNSIKPMWEAEVQELCKNNATEAVEAFVYHHDPRMILSTARNEAIRNLIGEAGDIVLWDNDIYCCRETLDGLKKALDLYPSMVGIAPVMAGYNGGKIDEAVKEYSNVSQSSNLRQRTHMPGVIGEQIWVRNGNVMRATMMRGAFWVKRGLVDAIAAGNPEREPWLPDFIVWQNVPFFVAAREFGYDFGYILDERTVVVHDDRVDNVSVGFKLPFCGPETMKALVMMMVRNQVFTDEGKFSNPRFIEYNLSAISRVAAVEREDAIIIQHGLLNIARSIYENNTPGDFRRSYFELRQDFPAEARDLCDKMVGSICAGKAYSRIKQLTSPKSSRMIYSVED